MTSPLFHFHTRFSNFKSFYGLRDIVFDDFPKSRRRVLDMYRTIRVTPRDLPIGLDALRRWSEEKSVGVAYKSKRHVLVSLRDSKLAVLPITSCDQADRLSDVQLRRLIHKHATDEIVLADHFGKRPDERGYGPSLLLRPFLGIESREGEIAVVDVSSVSKNGISAHLRRRPVAAIPLR